MPRSTREIRRRINTIRNTQQITRAMEMVSVAKLRRAQGQVLSARPYADQLGQVLRRLLADPRLLRTPGVDPVLVHGRPGPVARLVYVVITADRGLAGGYNVNLIRFAMSVLDREERPYQLICIGRKGRDFFARRGYPLLGEITGLNDSIDFPVAHRLSRQLVSLLEDGAADEVSVIYSRFLGPGRERPTVEKLLPLDRMAGEATVEGAGETIYVPSRAALLRLLLPRIVDAEVYRILLEAKASEHGARMAAMHNATENAEELIDTLQLSYNKARQAAITKELAEIVGGSEALTQGGGQ